MDIRGGLPPDWQMGQVGGQQAAAAVPSLMQMAQGDTSGFPTNGTPEGIEAAQEYARQLQYVADKPHLRQSDFNTQNILPGFGARYVRANDISYEPSGFPEGGGGGSGFYMASASDKLAGRAKPIEIGGFQGDVGQQLNRLPQQLRDTYGPAVVQHILSSGSPGFKYPGSAAYAPLPPVFESSLAYRAPSDAWGRWFGVGAADTPWPQRPSP